MDEEESRVLFSSFIDHIRNKLENEPEVIRIIVKRFNKASASFVHSKEFKHLMERTISSIESNDGQKYIYLKEFTDELKAYEQGGKNKKKRGISPDAGDLNHLAKKARTDQEETAKRKQQEADKKNEQAKKASQKPPDLVKKVTHKPTEQVKKSGPKQDNSTPSSNSKSSGKKATDHSESSSKDKKETSDPPKATPSTSTKKSNDSKTSDASREKDEDEEKALRGSRKQIMKLEKLLKEIHEEIQKIQEQDMGLEDLDDEASLYILEDRYKKKMIKVWNKLCELKGRDCGTGRIIEKRFVYDGTPYSEINRKISTFINRKKVFPDFHDIQDIVHGCNQRYSLKISRKSLQTLAKQVFVEVGNKLQERRTTDFVNNFGCSLTDNFREYDDPAFFDRELSRKLDQNRTVGTSNLEEIINKYAHKQDEGDEDDDEDEEEDEEAGEEEGENKQIDEEVTQEVEMEMRKAEKEDEKSLQVEAQVIEESESSEEEVEEVDDNSSMDEPILRDDYVVDGLQCTLTERSPDSENQKEDDTNDEDASDDAVQVLDSSSSEEEEEELPKRKTQARQDCSRLVPVPKQKECKVDVKRLPPAECRNSGIIASKPVHVRKQKIIPKHSVPIEEVVTLSEDDECDDVPSPLVQLKPSEPARPKSCDLSPVINITSDVSTKCTTSESRVPKMGMPVHSLSSRVVPIGPPIAAQNAPIPPMPSSPRVVMNRYPAMPAPVSSSTPLSLNPNNRLKVTNYVEVSTSSGVRPSGSKKNGDSDDLRATKVKNGKEGVEKTNNYLRKIAGVLTASPVVTVDDDDDVITLDEPEESYREKTQASAKNLGGAIRAKLNFEPSRDYIKNLASKAVERMVKSTIKVDAPVLDLCDTPSQESSQNGAMDDIVILD